MSVAIIVVVYALRDKGDSDLPTPLLSSVSTRALGAPPAVLLPSSSSS